MVIDIYTLFLDGDNNSIILGVKNCSYYGIKKVNLNDLYTIYTSM